MKIRKVPSRKFPSGGTCLLIFLSVSTPVFGKLDFENHLGLAGIQPNEHPCLAIPMPNLSADTAITLVEPQTRRVLEARVTEELDGACVSGGEVPALLGDHEDARYRLRIVEGTSRSSDVFIATLTPESEHTVRDAYVRADLDGDGQNESFRSCFSGEGLHLTVWSGAPLEGERRWHRYHYLGFEVDPSARDCTEADYAVAVVDRSRGPLDVYHAKFTVVRESDGSFGYDPERVDEASGRRIARRFHREFGKSEFPIVYSVPGRNDVFLVSAVKYGFGTRDFGRRFFLVVDENDALRFVYRGRGAGDSYILRPTFYSVEERVLVLAETGAEYTWGLEAYEISGTTMRYLGPMNVASWSGENYVNPLSRSEVTVDEAGYRVQFHTDLTLNPGRIDKWTLPKPNGTISFVEDHGRFVLEPDSVRDQVCFFLIEEDRADSDEVSDDFIHFFRSMRPWLEENRIAHSFQRRLPLKMIAAGHGEVQIPEEELQMNVGVVMLARDGDRKIIHGVHTDADLASEMTAFFGLE